MSNDSDLGVGESSGFEGEALSIRYDVQHFPGSRFCTSGDDGDSWA